MKKSLLVSLLMLAALPVVATDYRTMVFETTTGELTMLAADGLSMTFDTNDLIVNHANVVCRFPISNLKMFYFSDAISSAITDIIGYEEPVTVFSVSGICIGSFSSVAEATANLQPGIYVMKTDSRTFKLQLGK